MRIQRLTPTAAVLQELGERLARLRKQQGMSQQELATTAGVGVATLRRIEDGRDGKLGSWVRLLLALQQDAPLDQLLPEITRSPMREAEAARARRKKKPKPGGDGGFTWGDER